LTATMPSVWFLCIGIWCITTIQMAITKAGDKAIRKVTEFRAVRSENGF